MKVKSLFNLTKGRVRILNRNRQRPDIITVALNQRDQVNFDVYHLNVKTGELKPYLLNPGNITKWYPDPNGQIRLVKVSDGVSESLLFRPNENAPFKTIIKNNFNDRVEPIAFAGETDSFYALSNVNRDKTALIEIDARAEQLLEASVPIIV